jgi:hypothetical protein
VVRQLQPDSLASLQTALTYIAACNIYALPTCCNSDIYTLFRNLWNTAHPTKQIAKTSTRAATYTQTSTSLRRAAKRDRQDADQVGSGRSGIWISEEKRGRTDKSGRVRTLTGKEIELDIEADYKVRNLPTDLRP